MWFIWIEQSYNIILCLLIIYQVQMNLCKWSCIIIIYCLYFEIHAFVCVVCYCTIWWYVGHCLKLLDIAVSRKKVLTSCSLLSYISLCVHTRVFVYTFASHKKMTIWVRWFDSWFLLTTLCICACSIFISLCYMISVIVIFTNYSIV